MKKKLETKKQYNKAKISQAEKEKLRALEPIIEFANDGRNRGAMAEIARRINLICPEREIKRGHVGAWLSQKESKRSQPRLGIGLILLDVGAALIAEWAEKEN